tara:strand:- start:441 stop:596 length:156 start_codon:yes stop_codon:yes gene_type:complete
MLPAQTPIEPKMATKNVPIVIQDIISEMMDFAQLVPNLTEIRTLMADALLV